MTLLYLTLALSHVAAFIGGMFADHVWPRKNRPVDDDQMPY